MAARILLRYQGIPAGFEVTQWVSEVSATAPTLQQAIYRISSRASQVGATWVIFVDYQPVGDGSFEWRARGNAVVLRQNAV